MFELFKFLCFMIRQNPEKINVLPYFQERGGIFDLYDILKFKDVNKLIVVIYYNFGFKFSQREVKNLQDNYNFLKYIQRMVDSQTKKIVLYYI